MRLACLVVPLAVAACTSAPPTAAPTRLGTVMAITPSLELVRFDAGRPERLLSTRALAGLQPGETLLGIDYRVTKGWLYGVGSSNRLYRINPATAVATPVGQPFSVPLSGNHFGVDFNPAVDRLRIVSDSGQSLRVHPDTGAVVDGQPGQAGVQADGPLDYAAGDVGAGRRAAVTAVAYTYNKKDETVTTNYAIDVAAGTLVRMGSPEGAQPVVSPNTGHLFTVGALGTGPAADAAFDIADVGGNALAALAPLDGGPARWVQIDLQTGSIRDLGRLPVSVQGIAIEP